MVKAQKAKRTVRDHEVTREKAKAILKKAETSLVGTDMVNKPVTNLRIQSAAKEAATKVNKVVPAKKKLRVIKAVRCRVQYI